MVRLASSAHWLSFLPQIGVFADSTSDTIVDYKNTAREQCLIRIDVATKERAVASFASN